MFFIVMLHTFVEIFHFGDFAAAKMFGAMLGSLPIYRTLFFSFVQHGQRRTMRQGDGPKGLRSRQEGYDENAFHHGFGFED